MLGCVEMFGYRGDKAIVDYVHLYLHFRLTSQYSNVFMCSIYLGDGVCQAPNLKNDGALSALLSGRRAPLQNYPLTGIHLHYQSTAQNSFQSSDQDS